MRAENIAVEFRPLRRNETDHEAVWLADGAVSLAGAWLWLRLKLPWPQCVFLHLTGFPCPTCGATRCFLFLTQGKIARAISMNPLAFCVLAAAGVFAIYAITVLVFRLPRVRLRLAPAAARAVRIAVVAALMANWIYLIAVGRS
jgi:hypothetical protein